MVDIAIPSIKGDYDLGFTSYLFPDPDVPYSVGQVLDLFGTPQHYNRSPSPGQADDVVQALATGRAFPLSRSPRGP